ncbi:MAG: ABC transporter permease [Gemmatimonadaceae bacterium]|jgi:putative ABC transport system permease protein|nr:ABC transporter permease [Gemmatimonadaceae bacterium]
MRLLPDFDRLGHNVVMALDNLRVAKLRSALTILGVVMGVATVMTMATIVSGVRNQIVKTIEVAGPSTFYVLRWFSTTPVDPDNLPKEVRIRPELVVAEAQRLKQLPEVGYASIWAQTFVRLEYEGVRTQGMAVFGADDRYTEIQGGELVAGRWFTAAELNSGANVVVLQENQARRVFGREQPLGKVLRVGGRPATVIGIWQEPANIFAPPGQETGAVIPFRFLDRGYTYDKTNALWIPIKPRTGVSVADAQSAVTVALREMRKLKPGDPNSFDLVTQDQILDTFNSLTSVFFLVMIALSSVALLVGGIGVMAIMMVSVTDRTREIGVRKAIGATRRDIRQQFLVEAATLTLLGGGVGIGVGLLIGRVAGWALKVDAPAPWTAALIATLVSIAIGLVFGLLPAQRAARLDPIEALRYE